MSVKQKASGTRPKLNPRQLEFVGQYLIDHNATQAYIRAGYSRNGADRSAHTLLRNPEIRAEIQRREQKHAEKLEISADYVLMGIREVVEASRPKPGRKRSASMLQAALKGLELLGRHLELFTDKMKVSGALTSLTDEQLIQRSRELDAKLKAEGAR